MRENNGKGSGDLANGIDYSQINKDTEGRCLAEKSGLSVIDELIKAKLEGISDQYFFEYSILSSTINPNSAMLYAFAGVREPSSGGSFHEGVEKWVSKIIGTLYPSAESKEVDKISMLATNWFHNPEMFLFPREDHLTPLIIGNINEDLFEDKIINAIENNNNDKEKSGNKKGYIKVDDDFYVTNMTYPRTLEEMLQASKKILDAEKLSRKGPSDTSITLSEALHNKYKRGAETLKFYYDKYIAKEGEQYNYVTFPIISTQSEKLPELYVKHFDYEKDEINKHCQGLGHFFLYFKRKEGADNEKIPDIIGKLCKEVNRLICSISTTFVFNTGLALADQVRVESIKAAKAAIMSRNMSHNLGSHVMAYLKQDLSCVEEMVKNGVLERLYKQHDAVPQEQLPFLVGIGQFISYLQERQDFIATVATDFIPYQSVVNFKDAIYDELSPDYRYKRHPDWEHIGGEPRNILLDFIAKSEGLGHSENNEDSANSIRIDFREFNGTNNDTAKEAYDALRTYNFALPGGIMGRQAVFSIVENVIRNAAKHGDRDKSKKQNLEITFDIKDPILDHDELIHNGFQDYLNASDIKDLYIVTLTDNLTLKDSALAMINDAISEDLVDEKGILNGSNKGIKEMLISAAWLRGIKIEERGRRQGEITPILQARKSEGHLQYVFCLPKVRKVAVVSRRLSDEFKKECNKEKRAIILQNDWCVYSVEEYEALSSKGFNFVLVDNVDADMKEKLRKCSHSRFFVASERNDLANHYINTSAIDNLNKLLNAETWENNSFFEKDYLNLYKNLADVTEEFKIAISDTSNNDSGKDASFVVEIKDEHDISDYKYIYRRHNDAEKEFSEFVGWFGGNIRSVSFVEGITGGNSTDRLVRHETKDALWGYRHAHAMKTKVAIFDERIFTNVTGIEESKLLEGEHKSDKWKNLNERIQNLNNSKLDDNQLNELRKDLVVLDDANKQILLHDGGLRFEYSKQAGEKEIIDFFNKNYRNGDAPFVSKDRKPICYDKKGINVFTLTYDKREDCFAIWGSGKEIKEKEDKTLCAPIERLGCILKKGEGQLEVEFVNEEYKNKYHYLSIHQGLLDKIYEKFGFKEPPKESQEETDKKKRSVTKAFHELFVVRSEVTEDDYLPGLIVHSGRSKPNEHDMPQHQPFLQYSAVENAILDCKYLLVELLDFACYENK